MNNWKSKKSKILVAIGAVLVVLILTILLSINAIVRHMLVVKVDRAIANTDSLFIGYGYLDLDIRTGKIAIHDVVFQTDTITGDSVRSYSRLELSKVGLDGVNYFSLFYDKEIDLTGITIDGVCYRGILDTKAMEARAAANAIDNSTSEQFKSLLNEAQKYLNRVTLNRLTISNASAEITTLETGLHLKIGSLGMEFYDLGYSLVDSIPFYFNDSVMVITVSDFDMVMPDSLMNLQVEKLYTEQASRSVVVTGVHFASDLWRPDESTREYHEVKLDTLRLDSVSLPDMRKKRCFEVGNLRVVNAHYFGRVDDTKSEEDRKSKSIDFAGLGVKTEEAQMFANLKQMQEEAMTEQQMKMLEMVQEWLDEVEIGKISVENASVDVASFKSELKVKAQDVNISFHNIGYSLVDAIPYHFNDSIYSIFVGPVSVVTPDGLLEIKCNGYRQTDCGPIGIGKTTVKHTVDKWELSHALGDITATWVDLTVDTIYTSDVSPFSTVVDRKLLLDNVFVKVSKLNLFVDNRILTVPEFNMPSKETLLEIKRLFSINNITLMLDELNTEITGQYSNNGLITVRNASVSLNDISFNNLNVGYFDAVFPDGTMRLRIGNIHTTHSEHNLIVKDVFFTTREKADMSNEVYHEVKVDSIVIGGVMLEEENFGKNLEASVLRIVHPQYMGSVFIRQGENAKKSQSSIKAARGGHKNPDRKKVMKIQQDNALQFFQEWLDYAQMKKIKFENASADIKSINTGFSLSVRDYNLSLSGIGFNIGDYIPLDMKDSLLDLQYFLGNFSMIGKNTISNISFKDLHAIMPDSLMYLKVSQVYTDPHTRSVVFDNIEFATDTMMPEDEMFHKVTIDTLRMDGIVLPNLHTRREATVKAVRVINPHYFGKIDEEEKPSEQEKTANREKKNDPYNLEKQEKALNIVKQFFDGAALDRLSVENASADFSSLVSNLSVKAEGFDLSVNDISYEMSKKVYDVEEVPGLSFNDSTYTISLRHADILLPDSTMRISLNNFKHENCGSISLGRTSIQQTVDKWKIAHLNGDVPTTWFSMVLDTFRTSFFRPMNLFKDFKNEGKASMDSVVAVVDSLTVFRDMRYKPKVPYAMPQKPIMGIDSSIASMFSLRMADAKVNHLDLNVAMTDSCVLYLAMDDIWGKIKDVSLVKGGNINIVGGGRFGGGVANLEANLGLRSECPWDVKVDAKEIELNALNDLTFPVVGLNLDGVVHELRAVYGGDSLTANGYMVMKYNDLSAVFSKNSPSPYKKIAKHYKFLNSAARTMISHDNPKKDGKQVRAYKVKWENDVWKPSAMFMIGPVIKGVIETLLPGIYVCNKVKENSF